jgi:hypothetical protein
MVFAGQRKKTQLIWVFVLRRLAVNDVRHFFIIFTHGTKMLVRTPKKSTCMRKMFVQFFKHFKIYFQMSAAYAGSKVYFRIYKNRSGATRAMSECWYRMEKANRLNDSWVPRRTVPVSIDWASMHTIKVVGWSLLRIGPCIY